MLEKLIEWSIKNKFMVVLLTFFVVVGGLYALKNTPLDAIPDLSDVQVIVSPTPAAAAYSAKPVSR